MQGMKAKLKSTWQLQEAKNSFSEVVQKAMNEGPQTVSKHGKDVVVVVSREEFLKSQPPAKKRLTLVEIMRECPEKGFVFESIRTPLRPPMKL
jgi:prevent-host-death family protein